MNQKENLIQEEKEIWPPVSPSEEDEPQTGQVNDPVISARHLTKKFGDETVVQDVSFDVPRASIFGFIGPSGSGKTTTVRLLTGIYKPTDGEVTVLGHNPVRLKAMLAE